MAENSMEPTSLLNAVNENGDHRAILIPDASKLKGPKICRVGMGYAIQIRQIIDSSNLKASADDNFIVDTIEISDVTETEVVTRKDKKKKKKRSQCPQLEITDALETANKEKKERFPCPECSKGFQFAAHLRKHLRVHTGETPFVCNVCKKGFKHVSHLKRHSQSHLSEEDRSRCDICGNTFVDVSAHMKSHFTVRKCNDGFGDDGKGGVNPDRVQCKLCPNTYARNRSLKQHVRIAHENKRYQCDVCFKHFSQSRDLNVHRRIHTGDQPYLCKACDKGFNSQGNFLRHMRKRHDGNMDLGEKIDLH